MKKHEVTIDDEGEEVSITREEEAGGQGAANQYFIGERGDQAVAEDCDVFEQDWSLHPRADGLGMQLECEVQALRGGADVNLEKYVKIYDTAKHRPRMEGPGGIGRTDPSLRPRGTEEQWVRCAGARQRQGVPRPSPVTLADFMPPSERGPQQRRGELLQPGRRQGFEALSDHGQSEEVESAPSEEGSEAGDQAPAAADEGVEDEVAESQSTDEQDGESGRDGGDDEGRVLKEAEGFCNHFEGLLKGLGPNRAPVSAVLERLLTAARLAVRDGDAVQAAKLQAAMSDVVTAVIGVG